VHKSDPIDVLNINLKRFKKNILKVRGPVYMVTIKIR
jgi:hypothetical protein